MSYQNLMTESVAHKDEIGQLQGKIISLDHTIKTLHTRIEAQDVEIEALMGQKADMEVNM